MKSGPGEPSLLVWREERILTATASIDLDLTLDSADYKCIYCRAPLYGSSSIRCRLCGWGYSWLHAEVVSGGFLEDDYRIKERILRGFRISSSRVALAELGTHLRRRFSDIYSLSPYRFEELIGDIFRQVGYRVEMTKRSRDGGVDLFLLTGENQRIGIVQCKRYRQDRKVDISLVSQLLGTQLAFDIKQAVLVTTSTFTQPARQRSVSPALARHGFKVELRDAADILRMLRVYNEELPPLHLLDHGFLRSRGFASDSQAPNPSAGAEG